MDQALHDIMTSDPVVMAASESVYEAALKMKDAGIGCVLIEKDGRLYGIATDKDLVFRVLAEGMDAGKTRLQDICSRDLALLSPQDSVGDALTLMRKRAIRHLPIVEKGKTVGIVTDRDLAAGIER
jgi:CBS domain-containing protein